jgi:hypothetical protein
VKVSELKTNDEIVAETARSDSGFRAEWERTAKARAMAVASVSYRVDHGLTRHGLAELLGLPFSEVARLELGEVTPPVEILAMLRVLL